MQYKQGQVRVFVHFLRKSKSFLIYINKHLTSKKLFDIMDSPKQKNERTRHNERKSEQRPKEKINRKS